MPRFTTELGYFEITCRGSKNFWAGGLKLGYFSFICPRRLFFFKFVSFLSIQRVVEPCQCQRTFFSLISGIKTSWRAINIDYPLDAKVNNLIVFQPNWVIILGQKSTQTCEIGHNDNLIKIGLLWRGLLQAKKPICRGLVLWSFGNTGKLCPAWGMN